MVISAECAKEWQVPDGEGLELWTHADVAVKSFEADWNSLIREGISAAAAFTLEIRLKEPATRPVQEAPAGTPPTKEPAHKVAGRPGPADKAAHKDAGRPGPAHKADDASFAMAAGPANKADAAPFAMAAGPAQAAAADRSASGASSQVLQQWLQVEEAEAAGAGSTLPAASSLLMAGHGAAVHMPWPADGYPLPPQSLGTSPGYEHVVWQEFVIGMPSLSSLMVNQPVVDLLNKLRLANEACHRDMPAKTMWDLLPPQFKPVYSDWARPICIRLGNLTGGLRKLDTLLKNELPRLGVQDTAMLYQPNWFGETMFADILLKLDNINHAAVLVHHFQGKKTHWSELEACIQLDHICLPQVCVPCFHAWLTGTIVHRTCAV